ncbi:MAG TPA: tRNA pseudouridine(38-40) synthase TruA [Casimicrobiaceae bacterium]|nr:tRNA pseudouridine(38-40) synthase TruA [Casimicrobiaceae bacterium]
MRIALALEYDGSAFCGWQSQPPACGVQDALERALAEIASEAVRVTAAGRTDAGVHAVSQVAHFDTQATRPATAWVRGMNALLPPGIAVLWAHRVPDDFHARFAATARHYTYLLMTRGERPALYAREVGWYHHPLDVDAMRAGAAHLVGRHDFSAFRAAECQAKSPVKTLSTLAIAGDERVVRIDFSADAFLHHMVRNIVGSLVYVGSHRQPPAWIGELLAARDRTRAAPTFAASGLYLGGADYDARFDLPPTRRAVALPLL